ncbi:hypothetical protein PMAYCL1PPCAC_12179, partial [Pristionchus mayeri]
WTGGDETEEERHLRVIKEEAEREGTEEGGALDESSAGGGEESRENPVNEGEEEEDNPFADDEDDDEDGVQVTIGEIRPNVQFATKPDTRAAPTGTKGAIDLDTVPVIDGVVLYDVDLAQSEDKPWRKPGADPSDYFNYGFTEETWNLYCERQKKLRLEFSNNQQMVNRHIMAGITLSNPLGNAPVAMSGNNRVLVDNTRRFHHHRNNEENTGGGHTITRLGSSTSSIPTLGSVPDFSRPPPIMTIPTMGGAKADHSGTSVGSGEPAPPGSEDVDVSTPTSVIPPVNTSVPPPGAAPIQSIATIGGLDMSMPPPGFNPSMPPPHLMGPPGGGMPNTTMPPPGFNPMMPPPHFGGQGGPPMFGRAGYAGGMHGMGRGMGRPPPLMRGEHYGDVHRRDSSEFERDRRDRDRERERESSVEEEDRRHRRSERKKSRSPAKGGSSRRRDERSERRERGERGEERERSSRRHRSSSRDRRESRKKEESKRSRGGADEERSEKKKRRHDKEEEHSSSRTKRSKRDEAEITVKQEPIDTEGDE